jgi:hypothetical protein
MTSVFKVRVLVWPLIVLLVLIVAGGVFLVIKSPSLLSLAGFSSEESTDSSQVITSITPQEEVALLALGIQGIDKKTAKQKFMDMPIPGTERATFLQYGFKAKLGFDGAKAKVTQVGEDSYRISIPEFIFIGHSDISVELIADNSGALSAFTPEIKQLDMVNKVLSDKEQTKYIAANEEALRSQAQAFYSGIIHAVDPAASLEFVFAGDTATSGGTDD